MKGVIAERRPQSRGRGRPTAAEAQARDNDVLSAAAALFEQRGFAGVTMAAVARDARISKTTLYARYPDKAALFRAICSFACRVPADRIAAVATRGRAPREVLENFAAAIVASTRDPAADRFLRLAIFEAPRFPDLAAQILMESRAVTVPLVQYLKELTAAGCSKGSDAQVLADQFVALTTGGYAWLLKSEPSVEQDKRISAAMVLMEATLDMARTQIGA